MMAFFRILLFSKVVLLTQEPLDLSKSVELKLNEPISAITTGAHFNIDISSYFLKEKKISDFRKNVIEAFPPGSIRAVLTNPSGLTVSFTYRGYTGFSEQEKFLILEADNTIPIDKKFTKLTIESDLPLKGVKVFWRNYTL